MQTNPDVRTADLQTMCGPRNNRLGNRVWEPVPPFFRPPVDGRPPADRDEDGPAERDGDDDGEPMDVERWDGLA